MHAATKTSKRGAGRNDSAHHEVGFKGARVRSSRFSPPASGKLIVASTPDARVGDVEDHAAAPFLVLDLLAHLEVDGSFVSRPTTFRPTDEPDGRRFDSPAMLISSCGIS